MSKMGQHVLEMHESQDVIHVTINLDECYGAEEALLMMKMIASSSNVAFVRDIAPGLSLWVEQFSDGDFCSFIKFDWERESLLIDASSRVRDLI